MIDPTYSYDEVRLKLTDLDYEGLVILGELLSEEKDMYKQEEFEKLHNAWNFFLHIAINDNNK